jgi:membrane-associated phospholipid phosphatase
MHGLKGKPPMTDYAVETNRTFQYQRTIFTLQIGMIMVMSLLFLSKGVMPGIDLLGLALLTIFLWWARDRTSLLNFAPFLMLILTYESVRILALVPGISSLHVTDLIVLEESISGGVVPSHVLQSALSAQPYTWILDIVANGFYMTHFISAIALGLLLWLKRRDQYWPYLLGLTVLSYAAFLTYVLFPAAPPWWASMYGYLRGQPVDLSHSLLSPGYIMATGNPVASMPSLHTAYPFYIFFYCAYLWGKKALSVLILPLGVAISSIYLGHHYIIDILAGILYAIVAFLSTIWWIRSRFKLKPQEQPEVLATA